MTHKKILEMIENVDPSDTDTLDEIDARVQCYVLGHEYVRLKKDGSLCYYDKAKDKNYTLVNPSIGEAYGYTRSRDAIKSIRPDGWDLEVMIEGDMVFAQLQKSNEHYAPAQYAETTEELAELYATILAIAHERGEG